MSSITRNKKKSYNSMIFLKCISLLYKLIYFIIISHPIYNYAFHAVKLHDTYC